MWMLDRVLQDLHWRVSIIRTRSSYADVGSSPTRFALEGKYYTYTFIICGCWIESYKICTGGWVIYVHVHHMRMLDRVLQDLHWTVSIIRTRSSYADVGSSPTRFALEGKYYTYTFIICRCWIESYKICTGGLVLYVHVHHMQMLDRVLQDLHWRVSIIRTRSSYADVGSSPTRFALEG